VQKTFKTTKCFIINARDFGAVVDGIPLDTQTIQAALAAVFPTECISGALLTVADKVESIVIRSVRIENDSRTPNGDVIDVGKTAPIPYRQLTEKPDVAI
jgi:polygalacturonase